MLKTKKEIENCLYSELKSPIDWNVDDVKSAIPLGGCGDDIAEIINVTETGETNCYFDFCE